MKGNVDRRIGGVVVAMLMATSATVQAGGGAGFKIFGGDYSYNGFLREETAINTSGEEPLSNQFGDYSNGVPIARAAGNPVGDYATNLGVNTTIIPGVNGLSVQLPSALAPTPGVSNLNTAGTSDTFTRFVPRLAPILNYHILRLEVSQGINWGAFSLQTRIRALYDPGELGYRDFDYRDYAYINGGIAGGTNRDYHKSPDYFGYQVDHKQNPLYTERSGRNYSIDAPAFFLQWTNGDVTVRVGNQTVAWGQLLFFRLMDTANGLDLRRHLFLGRALEEYADERESAPGIRITWQALDSVIVDGFGQQFIPTILPNVNTPYGVIPSQFTLHDNYWKDDGYRHFNYGLRVKGEFGNYNFQATATRRYNPLGAIRWANSGINKDLPNDNSLGLAFNKYCVGILALQGNTTATGCGPLLAKTAFEASPAGVYTAEDWYNYAGYIKLSALDALNKAITDFPAAQEILAQPIGRNPVSAGNELDAFFIAGDGLRGHIERNYFLENVFGAGAGYVTDGEPGSLLDQLIINVESTYTPRRRFTGIDLGQNYTDKNEFQLGVVMEKYQRFFESIPATYMVFQALHQKNEDLAGLLNSGYGSENYSATGVVLNKHVPTSTNPRINPGLHGGSNYVVLAALQPTDAYIYEFSFATLIDVQGGLLFQPALQYKPRGNVTINLFYNYVNAHAWGGNENKNTISLLSTDSEFNFRIGYQF